MAARDGRGGLLECYQVAGAAVAVGDQDVAEAGATERVAIVQHRVAHDALPHPDGADRVEGERAQVERGREHGAPARAGGHEPLGDALGEVPRRDRVDADGQVRAVRLERAHGQDDHRTCPVERVERRRGHLFE